MGTTIELETSDGHTLSAYRAEPQGKPRGGLIVIQEIFGVNAHIRSVCDAYAKDGYLALAPALFDRVERGVEVGYDAASTQRVIPIVQQMRPGNVLRDLQACAVALQAAGKVGVVGYCYGGLMAWVSAAKLDGIACAIGYYGGGIPSQLQLQPRVPVMLHFGERDHLIKPEDIAKIREAFPQLPIFVYAAGHGFNCDAREAYDAPSAQLARERTLELLRAHVG